MPEENADAIARGDVLPAPTVEASADSAAPAVPAKEEETPSSDPIASQDGGSADTEAKADDSGDDEAKDHRVPKARFDQAVSRERDRAAAAEAQLKKYQAREAQQALATDHDAAQKQVKELLKEHSSLLADGDLDKASDKMEQVLQLRDDMAQARAQAIADNARDSAKNEVRYDATVERLEVAYPEINPDAEEFDESAVRRVQMMVAGIMQTEGKSAADALVEATDILLKPAKEAKKTLREEPTQEAAEAGLRRTQQQIDKNVQTAAAQPPATKDIGKDHDDVGGGVLDADAVLGMSWEEFAKIPDDELAKLRGDVVE